MRKTKIVALLLAVALIASMVVPGVAAEDVYTISVVKYKEPEVSALEANAGDTIMVQLQLSGNPGISSVAAELTYPEGWKILGVEDMKLFTSADATPTASQTYDVNPYYVSWIMANGTRPSFTDPGKKLSTENGALYALMFQIPEDAMSGEYKLSLETAGRVTNYNYALDTDENGQIISGDGKTILSVATKDMTVTVKGVEPVGTPCPEHPSVTTWTEVAENAWAAGGELASGHYKLMGDQATTAALTVAEGASVCVDLNGFDITAGAKAAASTVSYRVFTNAGNLTILDTTATGEGEAYTAGIISGGALKEQGNGGDHSTLAACGGNIYNSGTFTLVDGIIANGYLVGGAYDSVDKGGNIFSENGTLNIKGGWIKDGQNKRTSQNGTESAYTGAGNIAAISTDVNITGGMITGGYVYGTYSYSSGTARKSYLCGGNMVVSGGSLDIANATIADGIIKYTLTSKKSTVINYAYGGNIYVTGVSDVSIVNSKITDGQVKAYSTGSSSCAVKAQGGNIWMKLSAATNKMTVDAASVISGGLTEGTSGSHAEAETAVASPDLNYRGGNIYLERGTLDIYGEISKGVGQRGSIFTPGGATINVYEGAKLYGSESVDEYGHEITITAQSGTLNVYGGTLTSDKSAGGVVYALYSNVNIYGGTIENTNGGFSILTYYSSSNGNTVINQENGTVIGKVKLDKNCEWNVTGGTINPKSITGTGADGLTIGAGVTSYINPEAYLVDCVAYVATAEYYVTYADLATALAAAKSGDTIVLVKDTTADKVEVMAGATLDMNGYTLTASELAAGFAGTHIIDSEGTGKLVVDELKTSFNGENSYLPIYNDGGYVFEEVKMNSKFELTETKATYKFYVNSEAAKTLLDDAITNGDDVKIQVYVTWTAGGEAKFCYFELSAAQLAQYAGAWDKMMIVLTITGLEGITDLTCTGQVVANGVTVNA